uniref:non-specific serine/threonine protein kinase n=1 Tax=Oryza nivara TaxID=4536 RepID=A0A0E0I9Q0_ORYNI
MTELLEMLSHGSKKLRQLKMAMNDISGTLPVGMLQQFADLDILDFRNNNLTGHVSTEIGMLTSLTYMDLSHNNLSGVITEEHFASLKRLKYMDLSYNSLRIAVDPGWIAPFRLQHACFASCQMGPQFPSWLQGQVDITYFDISIFGITDKLPDRFWTTFSKVKYLDFSNNGISGALPTNMENMPMEYLQLGSNQISGQIPPLPRNITLLDVSNNSLQGPLPSELIVPQNHMEVLILSSNKLSGPFLERCTQLLVIDLSRNNFSGKLPMWIGDKEKLLFLRLSYNAFSGFIPANFTNLKNLCHLDLASNNLSVCLWSQRGKNFIMAQQFRTLRALINFSSNYLVGAIPGEISSLAQLKNLNLSRNYLSGKIPDKIGSSQSLESLDLSRNKLSGEIPLSLSNLSYLGDLDLSHNNLSGKNTIRITT